MQEVLLIMDALVQQESIRKFNAGDKVTLFTKVPSSGITINACTRTKLTVFRLLIFKGGSEYELLMNCPL